MTDLHRVRISCPDGLGVLTRVEIDGQEVKGAVLAGFRVDVAGRAVVVLELQADVVIEGDAEVVRGLREGALIDPSLIAAIDRRLYELASRSGTPAT